MKTMFSIRQDVKGNKLPDDVMFEQKSRQIINNIYSNPGVYGLSDVNGDLKLEFRDKRFKMPRKVYGDYVYQRKMILDKYLKSDKSIGALLYNLKGTGKTLLVKSISNICISMGMPVILIETPLTGDKFAKLLSSMGNVVVIYDEFTTIYSKQQQEQLLSILDGTNNAKMLSMFTANDISNIPDAMINRPGRIYFKINFVGIDKSMMQDCLDDIAQDGVLLDREIYDYLLYMCDARKDISWDIVNSLIEEAKDESFESFISKIQYLNIDIDNTNQITVEYEGIILLSPEITYEDVVKYKPLELIVRYKIDEDSKEKQTTFWLDYNDPIDRIHTRNISSGDNRGMRRRGLLFASTETPHESGVKVDDIDKPISRHISVSRKKVKLSDIFKKGVKVQRVD